MRARTAVSGGARLRRVPDPFHIVRRSS